MDQLTGAVGPGDIPMDLGLDPINDAIGLLKEGKELAPTALQGLRAMCKRIKEKEA